MPRDDRPWQGPDPPAAVYLYSPDRKAERPASHLTRFSGILQVDGYPGFDRLSGDGAIRLAARWAHSRRKFYDVQQPTSSPVAAEALRRIAELYAVENAIRGQTAGARQSMRQASSLPLVAAMKVWLDKGKVVDIRKVGRVALPHLYHFQARSRCPSPTVNPVRRLGQWK